MRVAHLEGALREVEDGHVSVHARASVGDREFHPGIAIASASSCPGTLVDSCLSRYPPAPVSLIVLPLARLFLPIIPLDYTLRNDTTMRSGS